MLKLIDLDAFTSNLVPVTSSEFFVGKTTTYHPEGLFSERIFGSIETSDRRKSYSFINLNCLVLHPALFPIVRRLDRKILSAMSGEENYKITDNGSLIEDSNGSFTGMEAVVKDFKKIKFRGDNQVRQDLVDMINFYTRSNQIFIDKCLVIPPEFRAIQIGDTGDVTVDPINEYYLKIIRLASQLSSLSSGPVFNVLSYRMNEYIKELYVFITSKISKKKGLLRSHMLGKRVDFTARAVISGAAADIRPDELGIPFKTLIKIFEPFIIYDLLNSGNTPKEQLSSALEAYDGSKLSALSLRRLFISISKHDEIPEDLKIILKESTIRAIKGKVVLAKRDPSLHAESVQAFKPVLVEGNTIRIPPIKCSAYNADFDGDQMALYVPITRQAIEEAKLKMSVTISKDGMGKINDSFDKDSSIGIYILTQDPSSNKKPIILKSEKDIEGLDILTAVKYGNMNTTVGRMLFNEILPKGEPFINKPINKNELNKIASDIFSKYGREPYIDFADKVIKLSYKYGTISSISFTMDDFEVPKDILNLKDKLQGLPPDEATDIIDEMTKRLQTHLEKKGGNLGILGKAGALKGGYDQTRQILVSKGLIADSSGDILPAISESYTEGFKSKDFFTSGAGSRKGIADRVLNTAKTGYMSRQLVYALQRVEADPTRFNCGTTRGFMLKITPDIAKRLKGRYYLNKLGRPVPLDAESAIGHIIPVKSPMYCLSQKICKTCYGELLERNNSPYVGVLSAQIFGERGTQLIMRTFHTGGAVSVQRVDIIQKIISPMDQSSILYAKKIFQQKDNDLSISRSGRILVAKSIFLSDKDFNLTNKQLEFEYGYFAIKTEDGVVIDIAIDSKCAIPISNNMKVIENDSSIIIDFKPGIILNVQPVTDDFLDKVKIIEHLLSGKKPWKSSDHFTMKIFEQYDQLAKNVDMVHFEVFASQLLRDKQNPSYPARLNPNYDAVIGNLKRIPSLESWLSALSFEDPNHAITTGLVYDRDQKESVLEQIVNGTL